MAVCNCDFQGYTYQFSSSQATFDAASAACGSTGGTLAININEETYNALGRCCSGNEEYWIGLLRNRQCPIGAPYSWAGSASCRNGLPLRINMRSNSNCEGIAIRLENEQRLPTANERSCSQPHRYICQTPISTNPSRPVSTTSTTKTDAALTNSTPVLGGNIADDATADNSGIIAVVVLCFILLFILLLFLYFWRYKKYDLKKIKSFGKTKKSRSSITPATTYSNETNEHVYYNVQPPTEADLKANPRHPNEPNYQLIDEVAVTSEYQEINSTPTTTTKQENLKEDSNEKMSGVYSQLELPPDEDVVVEPAYTTASKSKQTTKNFSEVSETVEYATVRTLDQPTEVYAVVNKTTKTKHDTGK